MVRNWLTAAGMAMLLLAGAAGTAAAGGATVVDGGARMRAGPGVDYRIIRSLPAGARLLISTCGDGWCKVRFRGRRGWVAMGRLAIDYAGRPGDESVVTGGSVGADGEPDVGPGGDSNTGYVKILGIVVDKPGYCYALSHSGQSIIVKCP